MSPWSQQPVVLVYTMTDGLGDYLVMGDLMLKVKTFLPKAKCVMVHRANNHVKQWTDGPYQDTFFNIYSAADVSRFISTLSSLRRQGYIVFGMQMLPGSLQGFMMHICLKKLGILDYIVDFNLINADIITPTQGNYILQLHLNQLRDLFKVSIPEDFYHLKLPLSFLEDTSPALIKVPGRRLVGIHPWSRRTSDSFFWPLDKWVEVIRSLLNEADIDIVILGRDKKFQAFEESLKSAFPDARSRFYFVASESVAHLTKTASDLDTILTVNTSIVHIGYALDKKMVILTGPTLDFWNPKGDNIRLVTDTQALLKGGDRAASDQRLPRVSRITVKQVLDAYEALN